MKAAGEAIRQQSLELRDAKIAMRGELVVGSLIAEESGCCGSRRRPAAGLE
jgi:hypothetical protein